MQSGISASDELTSQFNSLTSSTVLRGLIAGISKESLVPVTTFRRQGTFEEDLPQLQELLKDNEPAYIILRRLDNGPAPFISITYVPDTAHVRQKMLFASTRNTLMRELGTDRFSESIFATTKAELTAQGFKKHEQHVAKDAPLTEEESALKGVKEAEAEASRGTSARASHVSSGLTFPISEGALEALRRLEGTQNGLVQLMLNLDSETIELANETTCSADELSSNLPTNSPRYSFFKFDHVYQGSEESPVVFIYTCPPESKIKERMLYASCRQSVVNMAKNDAGVNVAKRIESAVEDISETSLLDDLHPKTETKAAFQRPKRPGRK